MKRELTLVAGTAVLTIFLFYQFGPRRTVEKVVPNIVTKYDTVAVDKLPDWYADSVKKWKKRVYTTDTVNIYVTNTVVRSTTDTHFIYVGQDTARRPSVWPIISYHSGSKFGDTAIVSSFDLKTGTGSITKLFVPGILTTLVADSGPLPRLIYAPFPEQKKPSLFYKVKLIAAGYGGCLLVNSVR